MGFLRKATFVATGGLSGVAIKANSKKERTAKALEKEARLQKELARPQLQLQKLERELKSAEARVEIARRRLRKWPSPRAPAH